VRYKGTSLLLYRRPLKVSSNLVADSKILVG
jgi:hypothetical protein